jgi:hypothetical protein
MYTVLLKTLVNNSSPDRNRRKLAFAELLTFVGTIQRILFSKLIFKTNLRSQIPLFSSCCLGVTGVWTHGLELARQVHYHLNHTSNPQIPFTIKKSYPRPPEVEALPSPTGLFTFINCYNGQGLWKLSINGLLLDSLLIFLLGVEIIFFTLYLWV